MRRGVRAERHESVEVARSRFGGLDVGASLAGMLVALAMTLILGILAGAIIGGIAFQTTGAEEEMSIAGLAAGLLVLFLAFLVGGWAAGRMSRYSGGLNGLMTGVWMILLTLIFTGIGVWLGTQYNVFVNTPGMPTAWTEVWTGQAATTAAWIGGIVALVAVLLGGFLGGLWGNRYHRMIDDTIARSAVPAAGYGVHDHEHEEEAVVEERPRQAKPLTEWSDQELLEERRMVLEADGQREDDRFPTLEEVDRELARRGYDLARTSH